MIRCKEIKTHVKMQKEYPKILNLFAAYNCTFVFLGLKQIKRDCIVHMDKNGQVLFEHVFDSSMETIGMFTDDQCVLVEPMKKFITILNLRNYQFRKIHFDFLFDDCCDQCDIHNFAETNYLCLEEYGMYNDNRLRLCYFSYPIEEGDKPFNVYLSKGEEWTYEYHRRKANDHSMFVWFIARQDNGFEFRTYDLKNNPKGEYKRFVFANDIGKQYCIENIQTAINHIWEMRNGVFLMQCIANRGEEHANKEQGVINNNYVYESNTNTAKFYFKKYQDYLIDCMNLGICSMFRTFQFKDGKALKTPAYYVDNEAEEIIHEGSWFCTYLTKYEVPAYGGEHESVLCQSLYEDRDVKEFTMILKKFYLYSLEEKALFLLTQLNPDFDYGLLKMTNQMLRGD